jgi:hypothetical protein
MYSTLTRLVKTWLPMGCALLLALGHCSHRYSWLVGLSQCLLFAWTVSQISRREAQLGRTTYATWLFLLLVAIIILLSLGFWMVGD